MSAIPTHHASHHAPAHLPADLHGVQAYRALSEAMQLFLRALHIEHELPSGAVQRAPLVQTHPHTNQRGLAPGLQAPWRIAELNPHESEALRGFLFEHLAQASFCPPQRNSPPGPETQDHRASDLSLAHSA